MIHLIRERATSEQLAEMLDVLTRRVLEMSGLLIEKGGNAE